MNTVFNPDKWLLAHPQLKIKLFTLACAGITVGWVLEQHSWVVYVIGYLISSLVARLGADIGFHRYFTHRSFKTALWKDRVLLFLGTTMTVGSCIFWVSVHRAHHAFSDTKQDPHSPIHNGIIRTWFSIVNVDHAMERRYVKDLVTDKWQRFLHVHYFKVLITWIALLAGLSWVEGSLTILATIYAVPVLSVMVYSGFTNVLSHRRGYVSFQTGDTSKNNHWLRILSFGLISSASSLHNNHHKYPTAWDLNINKSWYEFDIDAFVIKHLLKE